MKENTNATNFQPQEYGIFVQSTKIGTHENKTTHSNKCTMLKKLVNPFIKINLLYIWN